MGVAAPPEAHERCLNCGAILVGPYCASCGQRAQEPDPSLRDLLGEAWDAFVSVDGRVMSSLRLLLRRPGMLTQRYLGGQRARYVAPLRLYLVCSVAYFLVSAVDPPHPASSGRAQFTVGGDTIDLRARSDSLATARRQVRDSLSRALLRKHGLPVTSGPLDSAARASADSLRAHDEAARLRGVPGWLRRRYERSFRRVISDQHNFTPQIGEQVPRLMFVLVPVFAFLLALAYRSRRRRYPVHLVTALHLHAFAFIALTLLAAWAWLPWNPARQTLSALTAIWMIAYVPLALRVVYGGRLRGALGRTLLLTVEYSVVGLAAFLLLLALIVLTY